MRDVSAFSAKEALVVEDSEFSAKMLERILSVVGFREVTVARNGAEALALLTAAPGRFDVLVTDLVMPEMSGYELADSVRDNADARISELPILVITASNAEPARQREARLPRVDGFVRKPATVGAVYDALIALFRT